MGFANFGKSKSGLGNQAKPTETQDQKRTATPDQKRTATPPMPPSPLSAQVPLDPLRQEPVVVRQSDVPSTKTPLPKGSSTRRELPMDPFNQRRPGHASRRVSFLLLLQEEGNRPAIAYLKKGRRYVQTALSLSSLQLLAYYIAILYIHLQFIFIITYIIF